MPGNPPVDVQQFRQSIWYDNIRRSMIHNGELQRLIDEDGILGVTSNPTIFQKAIGRSTDYDAAFPALLDHDANAIFEALAVEDIRAALDVLRPVYDRTHARDGYVSLEVSPLLANDTASTLAEAKRLWALLGRPNAMIKIPATEAGIPAIEAAIAAGININVTLIFSVENYGQVVDAYIRGLEQAHAASLDLSRIASVASFFVSRIDVAADRVLDGNIRAFQGRDIARVSLNNQLKGKAAIANARLAYRHFEDVFYGERFAALRAAGAQVQRVLWASTGVKNPAYPETLYLDSLIGPDTVNTVPPEALTAFKAHGTVAATLKGNYAEAEATMAALADVGVNLDQITRQLQHDGVEAFSESFRSLIEGVEAKRMILRTGVMERQTAHLGVHESAVSAAVSALEGQHANARIWAHDGTLWKDHPAIVAKINDRLGWLDTHTTIDRARLNAARMLGESGTISHVVLLGMGGSSLAPEVLSRTFGLQPGFPPLLMLDSTDPTYIDSIEDAIDMKRALFIVSSKSGGTIETASFFEYFYQRTEENGAQFIAITDPGSNLEAIARERNFRDIFLNPADIGGRYSALSYFGLVPAALIGLDLERLIASADTMRRACGAKIAGKDHPGIALGAIIGALGKEGKDKLTIQTSPSIAAFGAWVEQLIAESLGKEGRGIVPVTGATAGKPHDYATDRLFVYLRVEDDDNADLDGAILALRQAGHPCVTFSLPDRYALGGEFFRWAFATAVAGKLLDVNPFDEPNVTESKVNTQRLLETAQNHGALPETSPFLQENGVRLYADDRTAKLLTDLCMAQQFDPGTITGVLAAQINGTNAGDYFALLAYLPPFAPIHEALESLRRRLRHVTRRAVVVGYGPRFLHSTGQLHKGGANNGVFIHITGADAFDLAVPGQPFTFGLLKNAQAAGDLESLQSKGRRVLRLHIDGDVTAGLAVLDAAITLAEERKH
ncbi:MAG: bifunctional transaldolase/phosoglucose isomerase [bacterium]|nr:bifunctional transaldolase/phosoglucose isomerase [bacterium]